MARKSKKSRKRIKIATWEDRFAQLVKGFADAGKDFYREIEDSALLQWMERQRQLKKAKQLGAKRMAKLVRIDFPWRKLKPKGALKKVNRRKWEKQYLNLLRHFESYPEEIKSLDRWGYREVKDAKLKSWIMRQRMLFGKKQLDPRQIESLNAVKLALKVERSNMRVWENCYLAILLKKQEAPDYWKSEDWVNEQPRVLRQLKRLKKDEESGLLETGRMNRLLEGINPRRVWTDKNDLLWEEMLAQLVAFKKENGHFHVPTLQKKMLALSKWVCKQRAYHHEGRLRENREKCLEEAGFPWVPEEVVTSEWRRQYDRLKQFYEKHGHTRVSSFSNEEPDFYRWVIRQRRAYNASKLGPERTRLLKAFKFEKDESFYVKKAWFHRYDQLCRALQDRNCEKLWDNPGLPEDLLNFLYYQRSRRRNGKLNAEQIRLLDNIGIEWNPNDKPGEIWRRNYRKLVSFRKKQGHTRVTLGHPDRSFAFWVKAQRKFYRRGALLEKKKTLLDAIGFESEVIDKVRPEWMKHYRDLKKFREENGHARVPRKYQENPGLAEWVAQQRQRHKQGKLHAEHIELLNAVDFIWDVWREIGHKPVVLKTAIR